MIGVPVLRQAAETREARCIVCGGTSEDIVLRDNGYEGRACRCGTIYTSPVPPGGAIDPTYVGHEDTFYDLAAGLKARWVRRHAGGASLMEVGCGTGVFLEEAQRIGYAVEGIEPNAARANVARERTGRPIHERLLEEFSCAQRFDVVFHCDMLAHFSDPRGALEAMSDLLAPSGVLAFEVGLIGGIPRFWYRGLRPIGYPQHLWLYSENSLHALLAQAGLRARYTTRFDLSACLSLTLALRAIAPLRRLLRPSRASGIPQDSRVGSARPSIDQRTGYRKLQNFLRYRVGALLPRLGPGTLLVVAERR